MKIRTQFFLSTGIFGVLLLAVAASLFITNQQVRETNAQEEIARDLELGAYELSFLSNDYLLYREPQQLSRWESKLSSFATRMESLRVTVPEQQALVNNIRTNLERLKAVFADVRRGPEGGAQTQAFDLAATRISWSRMQVQNHGMIFDASRLAQMLNDQSDQLKRTNTILMFVLLGAFGAFLASNYVLTYRRTLKSIAALQAGTEVVGSGNLDFAIPEKGKDEIGELSRAFNRMTADLKGVTASKTELEKEVAERKRAEDTALRQRAIQEGINRILEAALKSETEEELGRVCLSIAEEVTGSRFGFLGEIGSRGRLNDIAISDPGWEACRTTDPTGHGKLPIELKLHGIYGRVVRDGKAFFTNDPATHPDRIGTPEGHPTLTAFLGVPLGSEGRVIGMIGLGNREGGYRAEDLEAAEALAPAIVEALERKRGEEALRESEEKYRSLFTSMSIGYALCKMEVDERKSPVDFTYIEVNDAFERLTGLRKKDVVGRRVTEAIPGIRELNPEIIPTYGKVALTGEPAAFEVFFAPLHIWLTISVYSPKTGYFVALFDNITERKSGEERIIELNESLERRARELITANKELDAFAYSVSHDLRAPLRHMDGFSRVLLEDYAERLDEDGKKCLQAVSRASQRMGQLIDDLLSLSRLSRSDMHRQSVDLSEVARSLGAELRERQPERLVDFVVAPGIRAEGDARLLRIALQNLLGNAWKFTSQRAVARVEFGVEVQQGQTVYYVRDNGAGFDMAYADKLFGPFQRLHSEAEFPGSGIGLATVQRIISRHGGRVWAEAAPDQGAAFYFTLG